MTVACFILSRASDSKHTKKQNSRSFQKSSSRGSREVWNAMEWVADDEKVSAVRVFTDRWAEQLEVTAATRGLSRCSAACVATIVARREWRLAGAALGRKALADVGRSGGDTLMIPWTIVCGEAGWSGWPLMGHHEYLAGGSSFLDDRRAV